MIMEVSVKDVLESQKSLLSYVEELGPMITSLDAEQRVEAVMTLARILKEGRGKLMFSVAELQVMTDFFLAKLKDHHSLVPAVLDGILALSLLDLPEGTALNLVQSMFTEITCQSQQQKDRQKYLLALKNFLTKKPEEMKTLGFTFVEGFIQSVDGERDPRNLTIIFKLVPVVVSILPLGPLAEELFEVLACYFPIEFSPPPNDPYGVTKEELRETLQAALSSSSSFAEYCLNLVIEKLDSELADAKLDSFALLEAIAAIYKPKDIDPFIDQIWLAVRRELFAGALGGEVEAKALLAFAAVMKSAADGVEYVQNDESLIFVAAGRYAFTDGLGTIIKQCLTHLSEPEHKLMYPSAHLLIAIAAASGPMEKVVISKALPLLIGSLVQRTNPQDRYTVSDIICLFLRSCRKSCDSYTLQIAGLFFSFLNENDEKLCCAAVRGLTVCFEAFEESDRKNFLEQLLQLGVSGADVVRDEVNRSLRTVAHIQNTALLLQTQIYEPLMGRLLEKDNVEKKLRLLSTICTTTELVKDFTTRMSQINEHSLDLVILIKCLTGICDTVKDVSSSFSAVDWSINVCNSCEQRTTLSDFTDILVELSALLRTYCSGLWSDEVIEKEADLMLDYCQRRLGFQGEELPLVEEKVKNERKILLLEATYGSFRVIPHHESSFQCARNIYLTSSDAIAVQSAFRLHGALMNKAKDESFVQDNTKHLLSQNFESGNEVALLLWVTKGLAMRGHGLVGCLLAKMVELLTSEKMGEEAARGFKILMEDTKECLNKACHANVRFLYKQRIFQTTLPKLLEGYSSPDSEGRANYVMALMNQLPYIPHMILASHLKELLPVIVQSISELGPERNGSSAILTVLDNLIVETSDLIQPYASTIASKLLIVSRISESMVNRMAAMKCLKSLAMLPDVHIIQIREEIIRGLMSCLDDRKRLVRQAAAEARNSWFLVSQPGSKK